MAKMGLKYVGWAKIATEPADAIPTYCKGKTIGKAVSATLSVTNAEGELYADDMLAEYASEFSSAALKMQVDNIGLADQADMYGATYDDGELSHGADDTPPYGGIGGYQVLMVHGSRKYRAWVFAKGRAQLPDWDGNTKGNSITFGTEPLNVKIMAPNFGKWYYVKEFTTEAAARAYVETKLNISTWYRMNVQVQGADATEGISNVGDIYVASAGTFELTITGTPTALYDNGTESSASISDGKYTLSNVAANHAIAVIF